MHSPSNERRGRWYELVNEKLVWLKDGSTLQEVIHKYAEEEEKKESQFDKLNRDQEVKFLKYTAAADEMIQYLKSENAKISGQVDELKSELASIRHEI